MITVGRHRLDARDLMVDAYYNHQRKEILIAHFKHGTSYISNVLNHSDDWIYMKQIIESEEVASNELQWMHPKYNDYTKYITIREVEKTLVSAFCYEMRTGLASFVVDETQTKALYANSLKKFIQLAGGPKAMIDRWMKVTMHGNGTLQSVFYASAFPKCTENILNAIDVVIPMNELASFFTDRGLAVPDKIPNETHKMIIQTTREVFEEEGVFDYLKFSCPQPYAYKKKLLEKPLYSTT